MALLLLLVSWLYLLIKKQKLQTYYFVQVSMNSQVHSEYSSEKVYYET